MPKLTDLKGPAPSMGVKQEHKGKSLQVKKERSGGPLKRKRAAGEPRTGDKLLANQLDMMTNVVTGAVKVVSPSVPEKTYEAFVDEVDVDTLVVTQRNGRVQEGLATAPKTLELADEIEKAGQTQLALVMPTFNGDRYEVLSGSRRTAAIRLINEKRKKQDLEPIKLKAIILEERMNEEDASHYAVIEEKTTKTRPDIERAAAVLATQEADGVTQEKACERHNISLRTAERYFSLIKTLKKGGLYRLFWISVDTDNVKSTQCDKLTPLLDSALRSNDRTRIQELTVLLELAKPKSLKVVELLNVLESNKAEVKSLRKPLSLPGVTMSKNRSNPRAWTVKLDDAESKEEVLKALDKIAAAIRNGEAHFWD